MSKNQRNPNFNIDYILGNEGVDRFIKEYNEYDFKKLGKGYEGDVISPNGKKIEIKTEKYPINHPNFAYEEYSNYEKKTPGGPKQSLLHGVTYTVHIFMEDINGPIKMYIFETQKLFNKITEMFNNSEVLTEYPRQWKDNFYYKTSFFAIPLIRVNDIIITKREFWL